ncbi:Myotilin, partial [Orchesella cincta]
VSWIRRRDFHILTSGRTVYTNDDRFQIQHSEGSDEWTLIIRYVQTRDGGTYDCNVASGRGIIAHFFNLNILVPQAFILGAKEYHVQQGTVISLVCIIENSPRQTAQYLYWYHNNQMVNYGSGISVHTEPGIHTHSRLTIPLAGPQHAENINNLLVSIGNYTCKAANTQPATVQVYVSDGK